MKNVMMVMLVVASVGMFTGCGKVVPAGTTVVVRKSNGATISKSTGMYKAYGRDKVYFVDGKLKSFNKSLKILCQDDINMDVSIKWVGSFHVTPDTLDFIVEKIPVSKSSRIDVRGNELSLQQFWNTAMMDIISSITRNTVSEYKTDDIRPNRKKVASDIKLQVITRLKELGYPVQTADVLLTNLDYPQEVTDMRKAIKKAELQELENAAIAKADVAKADRNAEVELARGKAALVKAQADAEVNRVRAESLTPEILLVKQIEAFVTAAESGNNCIIMPYEALGSVSSDTMLLRDSFANNK